MSRRKRKSEPSFRLTRRWAIALILGATFIAFSNSLLNGFAYDDNTQILRNEFIRDFSNLPKALVTEAWFWRIQQDRSGTLGEKAATPYYRPVFTIYLMIGWHLLERSAFGWHLANMLLHMVAVYFAFLIIEKLSGDLLLAVVSSLIFALHPLKSESVAWISGLTDPLLAIFLLPSFYLYMRYRDGGRRVNLAAALALFLMAAFTKEPAVALPIFIVAYEVLIRAGRPLQQRLKDAAFHGAAFFALSAFYFAMRRYSLGFWLNDYSFTNYSAKSILLTIPMVICKYIGLLLWPINLSIYHSTPLVVSPADVRFILPMLAVLAMAAGIWFASKHQIIKVAALWFAIHLLPALNIGAFDYRFMVQERYLYIPSIGFSLLAGLALLKIPLRRLGLGAARWAVPTTILILLAAKTFAQNSIWKDDATLYAHGTRVAADQEMPYLMLGFHHLKLQQYDKVVECFEKYLNLMPDDIPVINNLANARLQMYELTMDRAHIDRAIALCRRGIQLDPDSAVLWDTYGHCYTYDTDRKNYAFARDCFARALELDPQLPIANFHMGATYVKEGKYDLALRFLEAARDQLPEFPDTHKFLSYAYAGLNRIQEAIDSLTQYIRLAPGAKDVGSETLRLQDLRAKLERSVPKE
jgi:tetratricopeptide (TPR) repeat protein